MTTTNLPIVSNKRECGTCTKCCEGWLSGDVRGHKMYPGKPCFFLEIGIGKPSGCSDYENRPDDPCKKYKCFWIADENIPDEFKPEVSGVILDMMKIKGFDALRMISAPNDPDVDMLTWAFKHVFSTGVLNMFWTIEKQSHWIGTAEFVEMMNNG